MGCVVDGYCSDCTRTFATGALSAQLAEIYGLVSTGAARRARRGARRRVGRRRRRGVADGDRRGGLADAYGHGLGHGVGLEVHEAPTLRPESTDVLARGNVVTVEPGLYVPGVGGCRIEDLVVVTEDGCEILTHFTKDLLVVG